MWLVFDAAIAQAGLTREKIAAVGLAISGPVNSRTRIAYQLPNIRGVGQNIPLGRLIEDQLGNIPTKLFNDADSMGVGEAKSGAGQGVEWQVGMIIGTGIGGGVIVAGQLLEGENGDTAGELGHMTVDMNGPRCVCGNIGCLEQMASGRGTKERAQNWLQTGKAPQLREFLIQREVPLKLVAAEHIAMAARAGVKPAQDIMAISARALGFGLANIANIFTPKLIVLGGGFILGSHDILLGPAMQVLQAHALVRVRNTQMVLAQLGDDAGLFGVADLAIRSTPGQ